MGPWAGCLPHSWELRGPLTPGARSVETVHEEDSDDSCNDCDTMLEEAATQGLEDIATATRGAATMAELLKAVAAEHSEKAGAAAGGSLGFLARTPNPFSTPSSRIAQVSIFKMPSVALIQSSLGCKEFWLMVSQAHGEVLSPRWRTRSPLLRTARGSGASRTGRTPTTLAGELRRGRAPGVQRARRQLPRGRTEVFWSLTFLALGATRARGQLVACQSFEPPDAFGTLLSPIADTAGTDSKKPGDFLRVIGFLGLELHCSTKKVKQKQPASGTMVFLAWIAQSPSANFQETGLQVRVPSVSF